MAFKYYAIKLSAICIVIFVLQIFFSGFTEMFLLDGNSWVQVWRFVTAIFLHGDLGHLLYNMFALALFGSILEGLIGERKFLIVFFVSGILANMVSVNFYSSSLGVSGAVFGIIGALILVRPMLVVWAFGLPMPIFVAGILWAFGDIIGIFMPSNVANVAHLSGMLFGLIMGALFRDWKQASQKRERLTLDEGSVRSWEDAYLR